MLYSILKPTKFSSFKKKIVGFDIETYSKDNLFLFASIYFEHETRFFFDIEKLKTEFKRSYYKNTWIVATNLGFDFFGTFINAKELKQFRTLFRGSDLLYAKSYIKNGEYTRKGKNPICFIDTWNYSHMSVANMGKVLGINKLSKPVALGKIPKNVNEWGEMCAYNYRDSEITQKFMKFLINGFEDLGANVKFTIASTSKSLWQNKFLKNDYFRASDERLRIQYKAYYGGRTEVFKRGFFKSDKNKKYKIYDFNSMYPTVMESEEYPDPNTYRVSTQRTTKFIFQYEGLSHVNITCPYMKFPLLPFRHGKTKVKKVLFPYGNFSGWYSHIELREAAKLGYKINVCYGSHYFLKSCRPFKEFVNFLYPLKKKYKEDGSPMVIIIKLILNSLYGKFATRYFDMENLEPFNHTVEELAKLKDFERIGNFIRTKQEVYHIPAYIIPIWSVYVAGYGRIMLTRLMNSLKDVLYCDTDSVITSDTIKESKELGGLENEFNIKHGITVKPKFYTLVDNDSDYEKIKIKGLGHRLNYMEFLGLLKKPNIKYTKFMKIKESLRQNLKVNSIQDIEKNFTLEDDKRNWNNQKFNSKILQDSKPLKINEKYLGKILPYVL